MDADCVVGENVHFECVTSDPTGGVLVIIYDMDGNVRTLGATERLVVFCVQIAAGAFGAIDLYGGTGGAPAAGERLASYTANANSLKSVVVPGTPMYCRRGVTPKVYSASMISLVVIGFGIISKS